MRRALCLLVGLALVAVSDAASGQGRGKDATGPRMEIEPEEFDFGEAEQNQKLVHEFVVRNVGTEDLEIHRISTSCGCTAALATERVVAPGEQTTLKVTFETRRYQGRYERTVSLASNDRRRVLQVRVQAFVRPPG
ncbi:MAG TPA: DUF1573 domain-containing protein [Vicinamibacteria bacterium]|nr:DUF1573 domain-containing protein [Vicinamibacteria bacterium]